MLPPIQLPRHPAGIAATVAGAASLLALSLWAVLRKRTTAAEREQRRRRYLATTGRIVDGALIDAHPTEQSPEVIFYRYRIAGVTYECSQDVSGITDIVHDLRLEFPVQVRYDRANPGDSIVIAEDWNGLWSAGRRSLPHEENGARLQTHQH